MTRTPKKFTLDAYLLVFQQSRDVFNHRFVSAKGKERAAMLMYFCEEAAGRSLGIPAKALERFPREKYITPTTVLQGQKFAALLSRNRNR